MSTQNTTQGHQPKTYVLLDHLKPNANVFIQMSPNQRVRVDKLRLWQPYLKYTYFTPEGTAKTIRYKEGMNTIDQAEQIKLGVPANEKFSDRERDTFKFRHGVLVLKGKPAQEYLEATPHYDKFEGDRPEDAPQAAFTLYDPMAVVTENNRDFFLRTKAAVKIASFGETNDLKGAQELLIRLLGSFYNPPKTTEQCIDQLVLYMNDADEKGLNELLKSDINIDEKTEILIGKAVNLGVISFDHEPDQVVKFVGGVPVAVRKISSTHPPEERRKYFAEYITSKAGELLYKDIQEAVAAKEETTDEPEAMANVEEEKGAKQNSKTKNR